MKKLLFILILFVPFLVHSQVPVGTVRQSVTTDVNGYVISNPLIFSNQFQIIVAPTSNFQVVRYQDLTNQVASAGSGNVRTNSSNTYLSSSTNTFPGLSIFNGTTYFVGVVTNTSKFVVTNSIYSDSRMLVNSDGQSSVDWANHLLRSTPISGLVNAINWNTMIADDQSAIASMDWNNRRLFDQASDESIHYQKRQLSNSNGDPVMNWSNSTTLVSWTFSSNITARSYSVNGISGITGVSTNLGNGTTNIYAFASGVLTNWFHNP